MNLSLRLTPWSPALALLIPLGWLGCESVSATKLEESSPAQKSAMTQVELHGSVHYLERMMLPPGATLTVSLQDVSLQDVAATKIATDTQTLEGGPPYAFTLTYDPAAIEPGHSYAVQARIEHAGELLFINDTHIPAFDDDSPLDIRVVRTVRESSRHSRDPAAMPDASLTNTYWKFVRVDGQAVVVAERQREPHMVLQEDGGARGHLGCNRFFGGFESNGEQLSFSGLASTQMACPDGMEQEIQISRALHAVSRAVITGDTLTLYDEDGQERLYAEAVYLP